MIFKKKELFLLIFLIFLQSCSGGRIGNFLESSFNDLETMSKDEDYQKNLLNKKILSEEKKVIDDKKIKTCLLYTSPSPRDVEESRMPSSA